MSSGQPPSGGGHEPPDEYGLAPRYGQGAVPPAPVQPTGPTFLGPGQAGPGGPPQGPPQGQPSAPQYGGRPPQQQPYGGSPPQQPPYGQHPGQPGPRPYAGGYAPSPQQKSGKGLVIGLIAGGLALVLIIGLGVTWAIGVRNAPGEALQKFFDAVVAADAQAAIDLLETEPADTSLMTDEVLQKSQELAPFQNLEVRSGSSPVRVEVTIGGEQKVASIDMIKTEDGWKVEELPAEVSIYGSSGVLGSVNGAKPVDPTTLTLLPGTYQVDPPSKHLEYPEKQRTFNVLDRGYPPPMTLQISDAGRDATEKAVKDYFTNCAKSTEAKPPGCPYNVREVYPVVGEYHWSYPSPPKVDIRQSARIDDGGVLRQQVSYELRLRYDYRYGGKVHSYDESTRFFNNLKVNLLGETPSVSI